MTKNIYKCVALTLVVITTSLFFAQGAEIVKVMGRGVGADKAEALKDAYRDAVERAVGLYVDAEQMMKNEELVKDQILTHSNAYIEKYDVVGETVAPNGLVTVKILAEVKTQALTKKVSDTMPSTTTAINSALLQGFHAKITTQEKRTVDGAALVENVLKDLDPVKQLVKVSLALPEPKIEQSKSNPDVVKLYFLLKFEIDHDRYRNEYMPKLRDVLRQVSIATRQNVRLERRLDQSLHVTPSITETPISRFDGRSLLSSYARQPNEVMSLFAPFNGSVQRLFPCDFYISTNLCLVTDFSDSFSRCKAEIFSLDVAVSKCLRVWARPKNRNSRGDYIGKIYNIVLLDIKGGEVCATTVDIDPEDIMPVHCCNGSRDYEISIIAPLFHTGRNGSSFSTAYYKWVACEIDKDDLPKIASVTIEAAE